MQRVALLPWPAGPAALATLAQLLCPDGPGPSTSTTLLHRVMLGRIYITVLSVERVLPLGTT